MDIRTALQELADDIKDEVLRRLRGPVGINPRTGENTLIGSDLEASIDAYAQGEDAIVFTIADYWTYVVTGWARTGNYPGTAHLFIKNVTDWVRKKGITIGNMTQNEIVWYLYRRMLVEGRLIAARPFIDYGESADEILPFLDKFFERWADRLFEGLMNELRIFQNR